MISQNFPTQSIAPYKVETRGITDTAELFDTVIDEFHLLVEEVSKLDDEVKNDLIDRLNTMHEDYEFGSALEDETSETFRDLSGALQVEDKKILIDALVNEGLYEIPTQFAVLASEWAQHLTTSKSIISV